MLALSPPEVFAHAALSESVAIRERLLGDCGALSEQGASCSGASWGGRPNEVRVMDFASGDLPD